MSCDCHCHFVCQQSHKSLELLADVTGKTVTEMMEPHKEVLTHAHRHAHTHTYTHARARIHTHCNRLSFHLLSLSTSVLLFLLVTITDSCRHDSSKETPAEAPASHHTDCPNGTYICTHVYVYACTHS